MVYHHCMATTMIHFHTEHGDAMGWHYEWAGGEACTIRVVDTASDVDIDVFNMAEPAIFIDDALQAVNDWDDEVSGVNRID